MANGKHIERNVWQFAVGGGGAIALLFAFLLNVNKDAQIAISVAEQHGAELLAIRSEITIMRDYIHDKTKLRYTSEDADRDMKYIQKELDRLDRKIGK